MNTLAQRLLFTTSANGKALVSNITRKKTGAELQAEWSKNSELEDKLVPSFTPATDLLVKQTNPGNLKLQEPTVIKSDASFDSETYLQGSDDFLEMFRLDNSEQDLNPAIGQLEVHVPSGGWGGEREHYMVGSFEGTRSNGWMEQYKDYPAVDTIPAREVRSYQQISNGRLESTRVEFGGKNDSIGIHQYIADMRDPDKGHQAHWLMV